MIKTKLAKITSVRLTEDVLQTIKSTQEQLSIKTASEVILLALEQLALTLPKLIKTPYGYMTREKFEADKKAYAEKMARGYEEWQKANTKE